jgi:hypothetical protein
MDANLTFPLRHAALAALLASAFAAPSGAALAATEDSPFGTAGAIESVDDDALSTMRGRWAGPTGVVAIGIDLQSVWRAQDGTVLSAGVRLDADTHDIASRDVRVRTRASVDRGDNSVRPSNGRTISGSDPTLRVSGLGQAVQLAGDRNVATNTLDVVMTRADTPAGPALDDSLRSRDSDRSGNARASASVSDGALRVQLSIAGVGSVSQRLGAAGEAPGVKQSVRIAGDDHVVTNVATIQMTVGQTSAQNAVNHGILHALRAAFGMRR